MLHLTPPARRVYAYLLRTLLLVPLLLGLLPASPASAAGEYLFLSESAGDYLLKRVDLPGAGNEITVYTTLYTPGVISEAVTALAVDYDNDKLYYAVFDSNNTTTRIAVSNLDGSAATTLRMGKVKALAVHEGKLYFAEDEGDYFVKRCDLPGGGNEVTVYEPAYIPSVVGEAVVALAVDPDADKLYMAINDGSSNTDRIVACNLDGSSPTDLRAGRVHALAVHESKLYLAEYEGDYLVKRCDLPGGTNEVTVHAPAYVESVVSESVVALAIDPALDKLYMAVNDGYNTTNRIARCNLDGSALETVRAGKVNAVAIPGGSPALPTTTTLGSSVNPSVFGQSVTFTATVSGSGGTPTGTVTFYDNGVSLGTGALNGSGVATLATSSLSVASHPITATYGGDATNATSTSSTLSQVVNKANTTTALSSSPNPSVYGQSVTLAATVSAAAPGAGTPTGTVTFYNGATNLGNGTLSGGLATLNVSSLAVGTQGLTATYNGNASYNTSTSTSHNQTVNQASSTTALTSSVNPSVFGQTVTLTATVSAVAPGAGTPTGTVTFYDGVTSLGNGTLSSGVATLVTSALSVATHGITATYNSDSNFAASASTTHNQVVNKANTTTGLVSSSNPSVFGQSVVFTATVVVAAPGSGIPTGTVTFYDNGASLGTQALSGGVATYTTSGLIVATHPVTATYSGGSSYNTSTSSTVSQVVNKASSTTVLASSVNPSVFGQSVTFTATVSAVAPGAGTPTGTVTFYDGVTSLGNGTLSGGQAALSTSALGVGTHSITAGYNGDTSFSAGTSSALSQVVNKADTSTGLVSSPNPSVFGQSVVFTATVVAEVPGSGTPAGNVTFYDDGANLGTQVLSGGVATYTTAGLIVATHPVTATYSGNGSYNTSTSTTVSQVVNKASTTTTVTSSPNPSVFGGGVVFTATVSAVAPGAGTPTGNVTLYDNGMSLGTRALTGGMTTYTTTSLIVATHPITATYGGDASFGASTSTMRNQIVTNLGSTTSLVSAPNPSTYGQSVVLTATVTSTAGTPTGSVTFFADGGSLSTRALSSGAASLSTAALGGGTRVITATYGGDANYAGSTSSALNHVVNPASTGATVTSSPNPADYRQNVRYTVTITSTAGTPTGPVVVWLDTTPYTRTLTGGVATLDHNLLGAGDHFIGALYLGDTNYSASVAAPFTQTIGCGSAIMVMNTAETGPGSLHQAVADLCPGGTITFDPTVFSTPQTITYTTVGLVIGKNLTIDGAAGGVVTPTLRGPAYIVSTYLVPIRISAGAHVTLNNLAITGANSGGATGGITMAGVLTITHSALYSNYGMEGGICLIDPNARLNASDCLIYDNQGGGVSEFGGAITLTRCTIYNNRGQGVQTGPGGATISDCVIYGHLANGIHFNGGTATLTDSRIYSNTSMVGGGVFVASASTVTITRCDIHDNVANYSSALAGGGGINSMGTLTLRDSAVYNNSTVSNGGGLYVWNTGTAHVSNTTFYGNQANIGGGVSTAGGSLTLLNTTVYSNTATTTGGGYGYAGDGTVTIQNSILANNTGGNSNYTAFQAASTHNLADDATCGASFTQVTPEQLRLGTFGLYGGETPTVPLLPRSVARDTGNGALDPAADQRGVARPQGAGSDIGAYEARPFTLTLVSGNNQSTPIETVFAQPLVVHATGVGGEPVEGGAVIFQAPALGASALLTPTEVTIGADGLASASAVANGRGGTYEVTATSAGSAGCKFKLTNVPPVSVEVTARGGSTGQCPGYNLYFSVQALNTSAQGLLTNLVITAAVPAGTWFAPGGATGTVNGVYSEAGGVKRITWTMPTIAPGAKAIANLTLHTYSSLANGTVIRETFGWDADRLDGGLLALNSTINTANCGQAPGQPLIIRGTARSSGGAAGGALGAEAGPLAGATVTATLCLPGEWTATTNAEGAFEIVIPAEVADACTTVTLVVTAPDHEPLTGTYMVADLRNGPVPDLVLRRLFKVFMSALFGPAP